MKKEIVVYKREWYKKETQSKNFRKKETKWRRILERGDKMAATKI